MIAVDTNVLVAAHRGDAEGHALAHAALSAMAASTAPWCVPWPCVHEFFRVVTGPRIFPQSTPPVVALEFIKRLIESSSLVLIGEGPTYFATLARLVITARVSGALIHDAKIAAICIAHGVRELWTADRDFSRFPELKTRNPLVAA